jgi:hypothetical protein
MANVPYTLQQQTAVLSILSNYASNQIGTVQELQPRLAHDVGTALRNPVYIQCIGEWSIVWGPVVWKELLSLQADNAMMAARNETTGDIVVAIAGTNPGSLYDCAVEDLDVGRTVAFTGAPGAWIAQGTSLGLRSLQQMTDPVTGQTMLEFLNGLEPTHANLIFTGHSLGGALSPTIAVDYVLNQGLKTSTFANVYVYPSAGPTPGNEAFAALFAKTFPAVGSTPFDAWNQNVRNTIDIVPHAWAAIPELPSIYPPLNGGQPLPCIAALTQKVIIPAMKGNVFTNLPFITFNGAFNSEATGPIPGNNAAWMAQAVYQHIDAYEAVLMPELTGELPVLLTAGRIVCLALDLWCKFH